MAAGQIRRIDEVSDESMSYPIRVVNQVTGRITCFPVPFYAGRYPAKQVYVQVSGTEPAPAERRQTAHTPSAGRGR